MGKILVTIAFGCLISASAFGQSTDSTLGRQNQHVFEYHKAALIAAVPTALIGILGLVLADEQSDLIEEYDRLRVSGEPLDNAIDRRNTFRFVAYGSIGLCVAAVVWNIAEGDNQAKRKRVQGQPWWMPKEKTAGISARINL
ncbi:hypothetical protein KJZ99_02145 [bacterium]|nr:hypothetical protein [bacterium]